MKHLWTCRCCGHQSEVSGDRDHGMMMQMTMTMRCSPCRELVDVLLVRGQVDHLSDDEERSTPLTGPPEYPQRCINGYPELACPLCGGNRLSYWDPAHGCPKCGGIMDQGETTMCWD